MYIVVNQDLNMSAGKIGAHTAHAVLDYMNVLLNDCFEGYPNELKYDELICDEFRDVVGMLKEFKDNGDTIIVLKAHEKDLLKWEKQGYVAVRDRGLTEVAPNSITAVNLGIYDKDEGVPKWIQRLRLV